MLTPSERVRIITEIGQRLGRELWPVVDLTLRQFSLPIDDDWRGDANTYLLQMIQSAPDDTLLALAAHVGFDLGRPSGLEPAFWSKGYFRLFLSHLAVHKDRASALQAAVQRFGISAFVAHTDIEPIKEWQDEIELALSTADALVALLTPDFHGSKWTDQEIGFAMGRSILILSVRLGQDPYGFIGKFQGVEGQNRKPDEIAQQLFDVLLQHKQTRARMTEALVTLFESSDSFREAKEHMSLIERMAAWPDALRARIRDAVQNNYQIKEATGVPDRVKRLLGES